VVSAAELIEALQRRLRLVAPHTRRPAGEFPVGWQTWLESLREQRGRVTGASSESLVAALALRPLATAPRRLDELTLWQAFATIFRQQWQPPAREDRRWRWFAAAVSLLWHLFVGLMLLWLMYVSFSRPAPEGESVVEVELIGTGSPDEAGGGAVADPAEAMEAAPTAGTEQATDSPARPSPPSPQASVAAEAPAPAAPSQETTPSEQEPQPAPAEQAVSVSEPVPDTSEPFALTPPTLRTTEPAITAPELRAPTPTVQVVEIPAPLRAAPVEIRAPQLDAPDLDQRIPEVAQRDIPTPIRAPTVSLPQFPLSAPQLQARIPQVRTATIPSPDPPAPAARSGAELRSAAAAAQATTAAPSAPAAGTARAPAPPSGRSPATTAGAGPQAMPAPGSWTSPNRADDWGEAARNRPGGRPGDDGLYNSDGSVRLGEAPGSASPGNPPGTVTDEIVDLDRAGTWLRRAPNDYEPTAFDRYWRPNETLLEEWVRKSIKTVRIPIPGTNKHIVCQTVLLALGGGCGISDPNLNEQSATARPPPDIPFKPELQEDNGSVRPPPGG